MNPSDLVDDFAKNFPYAVQIAVKRSELLEIVEWLNNRENKWQEENGTIFFTEQEDAVEFRLRFVK